MTDVQAKIAEKFDAAKVEDMTVGQVPVTAGQAFLPASFDQAMEFAKLMAISHFVPPHLRGKPQDCLAVIMQSMRWGMDAFAVSSKTYFVNDRMAYESQLIHAVVNQSRVLDGRLKITWEGEGKTLVCRVAGKIKGDENVHEVTEAADDVQVKNSPLWKQKNPRQQLAYYTTRAWARLYVPEVLMGVYAPEEAEQMAHIGPDRAKDVTPPEDAPPRPKRSEFVEQPAPETPPDNDRPWEFFDAQGEGVTYDTAGDWFFAFSKALGNAKSQKELDVLWHNNSHLLQDLEAMGNAQDAQNLRDFAADCSREVAEAKQQPQPRPEPEDEAVYAPFRYMDANGNEVQVDTDIGDWRQAILVELASAPDPRKFIDDNKPILDELEPQYPADVRAVRQAFMESEPDLFNPAK